MKSGADGSKDATRAADDAGATVLTAHTRTYTLVLPVVDVLQILDGIATRAESWEYTARWLAKHGPEANDADVEKYGDVDQEETREIEECSRASDAGEIAEHFREIEQKIERQIEGQ